MKDSTNTWRKYDDEMVRQSSLEAVLSQQSTAYILYYQRMDAEDGGKADAAQMALKRMKPTKAPQVHGTNPAADDKGVKVSRKELKATLVKSANPPSGQAPKPVPNQPAPAATLSAPACPRKWQTSEEPADFPKRSPKRRVISPVSPQPYKPPSPAPASPSRKRPSTELSVDTDRDEGPSRPIKRPKSNNPNLTPVAPSRTSHQAGIDAQYSAPVGQWEGLDVHLERVRRNRMLEMVKPKVKRPAKDEIDYDMGKVKKVRKDGPPKFKRCQSRPEGPRGRHII